MAVSGLKVSNVAPFITADVSVVVVVVVDAVDASPAFEAVSSEGLFFFFSSSLFLSFSSSLLSSVFDDSFGDLFSRFDTSVPEAGTKIKPA